MSDRYFENFDNDQETALDFDIRRWIETNLEKLERNYRLDSDGTVYTGSAGTKIFR